MKKILSLLTVVMLTVLVSVFFVGCGDDYKKMYLVVQYQEWVGTDEEGNDIGEWKTVNVDPDAEDYGLSFVLKDIYKNETNDCYEIKMRTLVKGTKKKVDEIYISCSESELNKSTVTSGEVFTIRFTNTQSPYLFVTPSIKSDKASVNFPLVFYSELESINANPDYYPAVAKGGELNLNNLTDLIVYNGVDGIDTNQLGVLWSIDGVEPVNNVYSVGVGTGALTLDTKDNVNKIIVGSNFNQNSVRLVATSVYKDYIVRDDETGLECFVDLKIVDNVSSENVNLNYNKESQYDSTNDNINNSKEVKTLALYQNSDYTQTQLVLSGVVTDNSMFGFEEDESGVKYDVKVLIFDNASEKYVNIADKNWRHEGIAIYEIKNANTNKQKVYNIEIIEQANLTENFIKFVVGFDNLKFTGKDYSLDNSVLAYDLKIERNDLPKSFYINGNAYQNNQELSGVIYDNYVSGKGFELNINAVRSFQKETEIVMKVTSNNDDNYSSDYHSLGAYYFNDVALTDNILRNLTNKIYLRFNETAGKVFPRQVNIEFQVLSSPAEFEGEVVTEKEYIKVTLRLSVSGSLNNVTSTGEDGNDNKLFNTSEIKYLEANKTYTTNLALVPSGGFDVATETVTISSELNNLLLSKDGSNWVNFIKFKELETHRLYIKADKNVTDRLVVTSENGAKFTSTSIKFVETTGVANPTLTFDTTYIYNPLGGINFEADYFETKKGYYLAMQLGQSTDFTLNCNQKTTGIFEVLATNLTSLEVVNLGKSIPTYAVDCVKVQNFSNGYSFNLSARNNNLTTVIKVDYKYYFGSKDNVEIKEETLYLEVAVYAPVNDLVLEATNDEIYYVNELITEKASTTIKAIVNSSATRNIYFSKQEINNEINSNKYNNTGDIFNIKINMDNYADVTTGGYVVGYNYLDLKKSFTLTLTDNILSENESFKEIKINFVVEELEFRRTFTKIITVTRHTPVEGIELSGTYDSNMYLSLLSEKDKQAEFVARVTNVKATYSDLQFELYEFDKLNESNNYRGEQLFSDDKLKVEINNSTHRVKITATGTKGGMFVIRIISPDSYKETLSDYAISKYVVVTISDGSATSPYYLRTVEDILKISELEENGELAGKYFVLASNSIYLTNLTEPIAKDFSANLNGVIQVYDPNTKTNVYSQYKFPSVNITNNLKTEDDTARTNNFGLFGKVSGTISNLVLDRVTFNNLTLENGGGYTANVGALAGVNTGNIINCSISILTSNLSVKNCQYGIINIGGLVGENGGTINYYDQNNSSYKKYASTIQSVVYGNTFKVDVESINSTAIINLGGIIGKNTSTFKANYFEFDEKLVREYLTARVDLWLNINSTIEHSEYSASVGGVVGYNSGAIEQVAVTGEVKGSGNKLSIGGLVGTNAYILKDSASYTTDVSGLAFVISKTQTQDEIREQFVGGAVGTLTGTVENVDVIFVDLRNTDFEFNRNASVNGVCVVGGLVGYASGTNKIGNTSYAIINGNVQSFFITPVIVGNFDKNDYITSSKMLGGLVGLNEINISTSFVNADIKANDKLDETDRLLHLRVNTLSSGNIDNAYFIGNVKIYADKVLQQLNSTETVFENVFNVNSSGSVYSLVMGYRYDVVKETTTTYEYGILRFNNGENGFYYIDNEDNGYWIGGTSIFDDNDLTGDLSTDIRHNLDLSNLPWNENPWSTNADFVKYNAGLPVLKIQEKETMIALPDDLFTDVSDDEFNGTGSENALVYQNENGIFISNDKGYNSAIVFLTDRTHNLVSTNGEIGLIEKTVSPVIASGQYYVRIISGTGLCTLSGNTIKFINTGRIELEFVSLFNNDAKDRVVIYVEKAVDSFEITNGGKVISQLDTHTNINKLLKFNALNKTELSKIDIQNLFLQFQFIDENGNKLTEEIKEVLINSLGNVKDRENGYYSFDDLQLQIKNIDTENKTVRIKTNLYLNLANYVYSYNADGEIEKTYEDLFGAESVLIQSLILPINIYQSAKELKIDSAEQNLPTSKDSFIEFDIISSYIKDLDEDVEKIDITNIQGRYLYASIGAVNDRETFYCVITSENEQDWLTTYNINSLWELFEISCYYSVNEENTGYHYQFFIELKEEYKAIVRNEKFDFRFVATTNNSVSDTTSITYTPQQITNLRIENFKSGVVSDLGSGKVEYVSNETHSSIIVPGKNGLVKIYVEPYYASVDVIEISSSTIYVNGLPYVVEFQQMLYDINAEHYVSYPGYTTQKNTLRLQKNSYINSEGKEVYTGVIYVRTILEKLTGVSDTFEINVNAHTYIRDESGNYDKDNPEIDTTRTKSARKYLLTEYNPGVSLTVENLEIGKIKNDDTEQEVYLIEKNSSNAVVNAVVYGYHLNQQPTIKFEWVNNLDEDNTNDINESVYDYISYSIGSVTKYGETSYNVPINITAKELSNAVKMTMSISLISEGTINPSDEEILYFYPVDYIPRSVYLKDSGNNYATVNVNSSMYFDFVWLSSSQELNSNVINAKLFDQDEVTNNILDYLYTESYTPSGAIQENYLSIGEFGTYDILADTNAKRYVITARGEDTVNIVFYVRYSYIYNKETENFDIQFFSTRNSSDGEHSIKYEFTIRCNIATTEETAEPIWTAEQFRTRITAGGHYVLMDNIELSNWTPMVADFASLDGNGKIITIKNFNVVASEQIDAGLFSTISGNTIIKNLTLDIGSCGSEIMLADSNIVTGDTTFGFIAGVNNGIIYNSEVISTQPNKNITVVTSSEYAYIGLFVGSNNGIITNSRVGTPYFETISVNSDGTTNSVVGKTQLFDVYADGIVAGFVSKNSGTISSSYFNNANIINTNKIGVDEKNMTAGFVAINSSNGKIYGSYAKGQGINTTNIRGDKSGVSNTGAGSTAGFVFLNEGSIENSYSNLLVESSSFGVAGFVYNNAKSGVIKQSYSASKVTSNSTKVGLAVELPFVGVDILGNLLSNGTLHNCYYLELSDDSFDSGYTPPVNADLPVGLNQTNFAVSENLLNFAFVDGNYEQSIQGTWTYYATLDKKDIDAYSLGKTSLPELTSANHIARSVRYVVETVNKEGESEHTLEYAFGYRQGTSVNPYIIRDCNEYNKVFNYNSDKTKYNSFTGHVRLIGDVDFTLTTGDTATINTTLGYVLGDKNNQTLTVLDGNGMTISGVDTKNNEKTEQNSLGLFNEIYYSVVKNLDIEFISMAYTSTRAMYSGGLAGKIDDSYIIGIDLIGSNTTISASNFGGGLVGMITGKSGIYNVTSNLSVKVGKENLFDYYQYISKDKFDGVYHSLGYNFKSSSIDEKYVEYLSQLSYAGGLAGVIDFDNSGNYSEIYNLNKVTIGESSAVTIVADIAGFMAGYIGKGVSANRLNALINDESFVEGAYIVGGMVAEHYGKIRYSQVSYIDNSDFDKAFADYVLDVSASSLDNTKNAYGTLNFVRSNTIVEDYKNIAGGFVGVNYGGYIDNSYTKANIIANANYIGGFIGVNYDGVMNSVYAQNFIDLSTLQNVENLNNRTERVGGFIAYNSNKDENESFAKVYKLNNYENTNAGLKIDSVVVATFFDKTSIPTHYENILAERSLEESKRVAENVKIDYLLSESKNVIKSGQGTQDSYYIYYLKYGSVNEEDHTYIYYKNYVDENINTIENVEERDKNLDVWNNLITRKAIVVENQESKDIKATAEDIRKLYDLEYDKQLEVFTKLFLSYDMTVWEKDNTKYFPTLKENPTVNFYEINTEADLLLMVLYPDANFVLNGDIVLTSERVNYVLDIEFTGMLIGRTDENGNSPSIKGIKLYTDDKTETAGFFRKTGNERKGSTINNVNLEYQYFVINTDKDNVGLLSAEDFGSEISGVQVTVKNEENSITYGPSRRNITNNKGSIVTDSGIELANFGGLFGTSNSSGVINSTVNADVNLQSKSDSVEVFSVGGLVGYSVKYTDVTMILNSNFAGRFTLTNADNIGGLVGFANDTTITGCNADLIAELNSVSEYYLGGVIGNQKTSYVEDTISKLTVKNETIHLGDPIKSVTHYIGGVSGNIDDMKLTDDAGVNAVIATVNIDSKENVGMFVVGGIHGKASDYIKVENSIAWIFGYISNCQTLYFGGLVGYAEGDLISLDNCLAYIENGESSNNNTNPATGMELNATNTIKAGGLIGCVNDKDITVSIKNSSSSGSIWPTTSEGSAEIVDLTFGGIIGEWSNEETIDLCIEKTQTLDNGEVLSYKTCIVNTYTTLMIETSQFKVGTSDKYHISAILGNINELYSGQIETSDLYYSSDFTLCVEEKEIFTNAPVDLAVQAILLTEQKRVLFTDGWETAGGGLPYRTSLSVKLGMISNGGTSILSRYTNSSGFSLNPMRISKQITNDSINANNAEYKYYFAANAETFELTDGFNGVLLGGGAEVGYVRNVESKLLTIAKHSVLSNLKVTMADETVKNIIESTGATKKFGLVEINNGTIFNLYLDYYYKPTNDITPEISDCGGIVINNEGVMLYCFNTGYLEEVVTGNFGGIATINDGYIAHSGFVGTATTPANVKNSQIAGFCHTNNGTIYNSYSAGVISSSKTGSKYHSTFIKSNSGTIENCVYDSYTNAEFDEVKTTKDGIETVSVAPVTTEVLQSNGYAGLVGNWRNYPMELAVVSDNSDEIVYKMSYNFGYPIYVLKQLYIYEGNKADYEFKGYKTGDGSDMWPYLLSNLGTVNSINMLPIKDVNGNILDDPKYIQYLNFKLVNDIDANKNEQNEVDDLDTGIMGNWSGVGSEYKPFTGKFTSGNRSNMLVYETGEPDDTPDGNWVTEPQFGYNSFNALRMINNLTGSSGLFNCVGDLATIDNLAFGNVNISNNNSAGALVNKVSVKARVSIYNILLSVGSKANMAISANDVGGIIGSVTGETEYATLALNAINIYENVDIYGVKSENQAEFNLYSQKDANNLGGIIGKTEGTVIVAVNGLQFSMNSNIGIYAEGNEKTEPKAFNVGGLFGSVSENSTISINSVNIVEGEGLITGKTNIGGIVGIVNGGNIEFNQDESMELNLLLGDNTVKDPADNVGGLVGNMNGGSIILNTAEDSTINITSLQAEINGGGIAGIITGGTIITPSENPSVINISSLQSIENAGGLAGLMQNLNIEDKTVPSVIAGFELNFENGEDNAYYATRFGGAVGKMISGHIGSFADLTAINGGEGETTELKVILSGEIEISTYKIGTTNKGGQFGTIVGSIEPVKDDSETSENEANGDVNINSVESELGITLKYSDQVSVTGATISGFGGIAGFVRCFDDDFSSTITLGNIILKGNKLQTDDTIENIGGLFGNLQANRIYTKLLISDVFKFTLKGVETTDSEVSGDNALENPPETKIEISGMKVQGYKNVGGFAGNYVNSQNLMVEEGLVQFLDMTDFEEDGYVQILLPDSDTGVPEVANFGAVNFGGLFGSYDCSVPYEDATTGDITYTTNLTFSKFEFAEDGAETTEELTFVNLNNVMYYEGGANAEDSFAEEFSLYGKTYTVNNVGGIAGMISAKGEVILNATNKAEFVGSGYEDGDKKYSELTDKDFLSEEVQKTILNLNNVGGIVGKVVYSSATEATNNTIIVKDSINDANSTINGYEYVGGIIGTVDNNCNMNIDVQSATIDGNVYGRKYLGGLAGHISTVLTWTPENKEINNSGTTYKMYEPLININVEVSGHGYIGGVVGYIKVDEQQSDIGAFKTKGITVNGLINIGGIVGRAVGYYDSAEDLPVQVVIGGTTQRQKENPENPDEEPPFIYGTYKEFEITGNSNVGGIVGAGEYVTVSSFYDFDGKSENTIFNDISIMIQVVEYKFGPDTDVDEKEDVYYMPTSIGGVIGNGQNSKVSMSVPMGNIVSEDRQEELSTLNNYIIKNNQYDYMTGSYITDEITGESKYISSGKFGNLNSQNFTMYESVKSGVGGLIGTSISNNDIASNSQSGMHIDAPSGMNVGGIAGYHYLEPNQDGAELNLGNYNNFLANKDVYIAGGMGVGTLFGFLDSSSEINFKNKLERESITYLQQKLVADINGSIEIDGVNYTTQSVFGTYVGGLIGRTGSVNNIYIDASAKIRIDNSQGSYFGGIIGWINGNMNGAKNETDSDFESSTNLFRQPKNFNYGGLVGLVKVDGVDISVLGSHDYMFTVDTVLTYDGSYENSNQNIEFDDTNNLIYMIANLTMKNAIKISAASSSLNFNPILEYRDDVTTSGWAKEYTMFRRVAYGVQETVDGIRVDRTASETTVYNAEYITEVSFDGGKIEYTIYDDGNSATMYTRYGIAENFITSANTSETELEKDILTRLAVNMGSNPQNLFNRDEDQIYDFNGTFEYGLSYKRVLVHVNNIQPEGANNNARILNVENKHGPEEDSHWSWFKNFNSEKVLLKILNDSGYNLEEAEKRYGNDALKDMYLDVYLMKCSDDGKYANTYFKYETIYSELDNTYEIGSRKACITNMAEDGSIFNVNGSIINRGPINITGNGTWQGWKWVGSALTGFLPMKLISWIVSNVTSADPELAQQARELMFMTSVYEGNYGFMGETYTRETQFNDYKLVGESDKTARFPTVVTNNGTTKGTYTMLYYYYSQSRPADINDSIVITDDNCVILSQIKQNNDYTVAVGDTMAKYYYYDGAYYINAYGLEYAKNYETGYDVARLPSGSGWWYRTDEGLYYIAEGNWLDDGNSYGLNRGNLEYGNKVTRDLYFSFDSNYDPTGKIEGYDYIIDGLRNQTFGIVSRDEFIYGYDSETYNYIVDNDLFVYLDVSYDADGQMLYQGATVTDPYSTPYFIVPFDKDGNNFDATPSTLPKDSFSFSTDIKYISGSDLANWIDHNYSSLYMGAINVSQKIKDSEMYYKFIGFDLGENANAVKGSTHDYYYYYSEGSIVRNGKVYTLVDDKKTTVYKITGDTANAVLLSDVDTNNIGDYFVINYKAFDNVSDSNKYQLSNFYIYVNGAWYEVDETKFVDSINGGGQAIAKIVATNNGAWSENKNLLKINYNNNEYIIYTRYKFTANENSWADYDLDNDSDWNRFLKLLPATGYGSMGNYKMSEIAMFSFNTYESGIQTKGFICS